MLLVQVASYTLVFVLARYRLVAVACLILFASRFLGDVIQIIVERRRGALALAAAVALGCALLVHISFAEFPYERGFPTMSRRIERIQSQRRNSKTLWNDQLHSQPWYSTSVKRIADCRLG
jgi:hypothetical protein